MLSGRRNIGAATTLIVGLLVPLSGISSAVDRPSPKVVDAIMRDGNGNGRADSMVLTYSEKIKHTKDKDGNYPLSVPGYKVKKVNGANNTTDLKIVLKELAVPDLSAKPPVTYAKTNQKPVSDMAGNQAKNQTFSKTLSLDLDDDGLANTVDDCDDSAEDSDGFQDEDGCPDPDNDGDGLLDDDDDDPNNACVPNPSVDCDPDGDGISAAQGDCAPQDGAIYPGAVDNPDVQFTDSDCDGIDGKPTAAIFVAPSGSDASPGTMAAPKQTLAAAVAAAATSDPIKDVYAAAGPYNGTVNLVTHVGIYGAYDATDWSRSAANETYMGGQPQGMLADGDVDVLLQYLTIYGLTPSGSGQSSYGLRAIGGSDVFLQKTKVVGGTGTPGQAGATQGFSPTVPGGGYVGGSGGLGGYFTPGYYTPAEYGRLGGGFAPGNSGAFGPYPNINGGFGGIGGAGDDGTAGAGGTLDFNDQGPLWSNASGNGGTGGTGTAGSGGGGGGGGGGNAVEYSYPCQCNFLGCFATCYGTTYYDGGNGGNGGRGGAPATGGSGGTAGGASFGVYLHNSSLTVLDCEISSGDGGNGGAGRAGGVGGPPGGAQSGQGTDAGDGGPGGAGGRGGHGGGGGGGAGGPSIALFMVGTSHYYSFPNDTTTLTAGTPGQGGGGGSSSGSYFSNGVPGANGEALDRYGP